MATGLRNFPQNKTISCAKSRKNNRVRECRLSVSVGSGWPNIRRVRLWHKANLPILQRVVSYEGKRSARTSPTDSIDPSDPADLRFFLRRLSVATRT